LPGNDLAECRFFTNPADDSFAGTIRKSICPAARKGAAAQSACDTNFLINTRRYTRTSTAYPNQPPHGGHKFCQADFLILFESGERKKNGIQKGFESKRLTGFSLRRNGREQGFGPLDSLTID
jgi:hypothetical protein